MNNNNPFKQNDDAYQASLNNAYKAAQSYNNNGIRMLPEGKYQCIIDAFSLKPSKLYSDELNLILGFSVITGEHKGETVFKYYAITPENLDRLKTDMITLNIDLSEDITILGEMKTAEAILDQIVDINIKHRRKKNGEGFYQNVYIVRSLGKADDTFMETEPGETPFD